MTLYVRKSPPPPLLGIYTKVFKGSIACCLAFPLKYFHKKRKGKKMGIEETSRAEY